MLATFRTIDGSGNNQTAPGADFGVAGSSLIRSGYDAEYPDGFGDLITSATAPNPRDVSNAISAQDTPVFSSRNLSDWIVQWGQFITHDMDFTATDAANNELSTGTTVDFGIPITDTSDPLGPNSIPFNRSDFDPTTGDSSTVPLPGPGNRTRLNWREQINGITSYIDASNIYGSDTTRATALRTFVDGKLKTTADGLLPGLNDVGEENDNAVGHDPTDLFLAGDVRANEAVGLTATHALFVREHNRLADLLKTESPGLTDEEIYHWARKIVGAEMQIITYEEFLPALMGDSTPDPNAYAYDNRVDASVTTSFSTAFFRFGHSQQSSTLKLVNDDGSMAGEFSLANIFFNPDILQESPTLVDQIMKGLASQVSQENDILVVDEIRNFLFGPPGAGGLDLAALDIQRGRDHGMLDYNEFRRTYDLQPLNNFSQLTSDTALQAGLQSLYGNINNVDAWVGGISENHMAGKSIGGMLNASFIEQFTRTRDGDRFFYTGDADLNDSLVTSIIDLDNLTLASIIRNNTGNDNIQNNVFFTNAGFSVVETDGDTAVSESAATDTFAVTLNRAPTTNVVLTVITGDSGEATVDKTTLTFTPASWSTAQVVTVTGVDDLVVDGDQSIEITIAVNDASSDDDFDLLSDQVILATNTDDDTPSQSLMVSTTALAVTEGSANSFAVSLSLQPSSNVTVSVATTGDSDITTGATTLTFTPSNWNTNQDVTVNAAEDVDLIDGAATISISSTGLETVDVVATEDDNDTQTIVVMPGSLTLVEGSSATLAVSLSNQPSANITLVIATSGDSDVTTNTANLTFTPQNWNTTQEVTVNAAEDVDLADGIATISVSSTSLTTVDILTTENDNDTQRLMVTPTAITVTEGGSDTFAVALAHQPASNVMVAVVPTGDTDMTTSQSSLTFTPSNWNTTQNVRIDAAEDVDLTAGVTTFVVSSVGLESVSVLAAEDDNDSQTIVVTPTALTVNEGGAEMFTVSLAHPPASDVTIAVTPTGDANISTGQTSLTFTRSNWIAGQTVTVTASEDPDLVNGVATIAISSAGLAGVDVSVTEADNDTQSLVVTPTTLTVTEGSTDTFAVSLSQQPSTDVAVATNRISGDSDLTITGGENLIFTPESWNIAQTVTLAAEEDTDVANGSAVFDVMSSGLATVRLTGTELDNDERLPKPSVDYIPRFPDRDSPTFRWQAVTGAVSYNAWLTRRFPAVSRVLAGESAVATTSFTPAANLDAGYYKFWVQAIDSKGIGGTWSDVRSFEVRPNLGTSTIVSFNSPPTFTWATIPNAPGYELYIRASDGQNTVIDDITTTSYTPTTTLSQTDGRWWIRSSDAIGNRGWSLAGEFATRTEITTPVGSQTTTTPTISWLETQGAGRYILHVTNLDTNTVAVREDDLTSAIYTPLEALPSGNYRAWVKAIDGTTNLFSSGVWSFPVNFTITAMPSRSGRHAGDLAEDLLPELVTKLPMTSQSASAQNPISDQQTTEREPT